MLVLYIIAASVLLATKIECDNAMLPVFASRNTIWDVEMGNPNPPDFGPRCQQLPQTTSSSRCYWGAVRDIAVNDLKLATLGREPRSVARGGTVLGTDQRAFIQRFNPPHPAERLRADGHARVCVRQHKSPIVARQLSDP